MEAAAIPETLDGGEVAEHDDPAKITVNELFRFSTWVHLGPKAEDCEAVDEEAGTNDCSDPTHFHAWCRLPNQFQHRDIREKALAAKARTARRMRDPDSDAHAILEEELDDLRRSGEEEARKSIIDDLVSKDWWRDFTEAQKDVKEQEVEDTKPFEHIDEDQRRLAELNAMAPGERPDDEFEELIRQIGRYQEALRVRTEEIAKPRRDALEQKSTDELFEELRADRIESEAQADFMHIYNVWEWYLGTLRVPRGDRMFASIEHMTEGSAPEVLDAIQQAFVDLEQAKAAQGNS